MVVCQFPVIIQAGSENNIWVRLSFNGILRAKKIEGEEGGNPISDAGQN